MKRRILLGTSAIALIMAVQNVSADNKITRDLQISTASLERFYIDAGAGDLIVRGVDGIETIEVVAKIRGRGLNESDFSLSLERKGDKAVLYAHIEAEGFSNRYIDLEITTPSKLRLDILDRSGDMEIENMRSGLHIDDRSGDIKVRDLNGDLNIQDRSGDIDLYTVVGDVDIEDRSGDLVLMTVTGNVKVEDNSGDITIKTVAGNVDLDDGSGDIDITDVSGKVGVQDGAGDIMVDGAGFFTLYQDGRGEVELVNVEHK